MRRLMGSWRVRFRGLRAPDKLLLTKPNSFLHKPRSQRRYAPIVFGIIPDWIRGRVRVLVGSFEGVTSPFKIATVTQELGEETGERRFDRFLVGSFAVRALFLAALGIYGLLHAAVVQRTNEIGVRVALGARPGAVIALVLRKGLTLAVIGAGRGLVGASWCHECHRTVMRWGLTQIASSSRFFCSAVTTSR
jgi:hypothetical protein